MSYLLPYLAGSLDGFMLRNIIRITFSWITKGMKSETKGKKNTHWNEEEKSAQGPKCSQTSIPIIFRSLRISILMKTFNGNLRNKNFHLFNSNINKHTNTNICEFSNLRILRAADLLLLLLL